MKSLPDRIVECLLTDGVLPRNRLQAIHAQQEAQGGDLLRLLTQQRVVTDEDVVVGLAACLGLQPVRVSDMKIPADVVKLIPRELALAHKMVPTARLGRQLYVAMADPLDVLALDEIRGLLPRWELVPQVATEKCITDFLHDTQGSDSVIDDLLLDVDQEELELQSDIAEEADLDHLLESSQTEPVIKLVNGFLAQAVRDGASDLHFEPAERCLRLRYRIDGILYDMRSIPKSLQSAIISRLKVMAKLDIAEHRLPQDGRFRVRVLGREIDLRISVVSSVHGEKVALRLLDKSRMLTSLAGQDLDPRDLEQFNRAITAPHGMVLITGPTGSGKTSTLYAALAQLNTSDVHIVTVEDPVEYQLAGINQIPVNADIGMTFASGLRSILRQDPDIIMVGEIRDFETADMAVKSALTGHLVLSTLHTNDAPGAITRLIDMSIEPFLVSSSLLLVCAQRLVRRICPHCKEPVSVPDDLRERLHLDVAEVEDHVFYRGAGCARCSQTGYRGRLAIMEILPISSGLRELILSKANATMLQQLALREGMRTLRQSGLDKAKVGLTSLDEVLRVTAND